mgnify:CR=1 FL=1
MAAEESHTLPKAERLCGQTAVSALLQHGKTGVEGCLRYRYLPGGGEVSRILVSVPKRSFRRAVKRNLLKRRIREAYRVQKHLLSAPVDIQFIYIAPDVLPFEDIFRSVGQCLTACHSERSEES